MDKPRDLAFAIGNVLYEKGAKEIQILRVDHMTTIADFFVVASGRNAQAVRALAEDVEDKMTEKGVEPRRKEGVNESRWIVLDFASVIVHVFHPEEREYYNIERLWLDGTNIVEFTPDKSAV